MCYMYSDARDKLIVFFAGRGFLTKIAGFFAGFSSGVLISCYRVLPGGGGAGGKDVLNETSADLFISLQDKAKYYSYY